jgi:transcriptional regulator with XRE-family HTH domain
MDEVTGRRVRALYAGSATSLLAAHRQARGWTLEEAVRRLAALRTGAGTRRITVQMLCAWERGRVLPSTANADQLCQLYQTRADLLGLSRDYTEEEPKPPTPGVMPPPGTPSCSVASRLAGETTDPRRSAVREVLSHQLAPREVDDVSSPVLAQLASVRMQAERMLLGDAEVPEDLRVWEEKADWYMREHYRAPNPDRLPRILADIIAVQDLLVSGHPERFYREAYRILGQLAGLTGLNMIAASAYDEAEAWYVIARTMAHTTGDQVLEAWALTHHSFVPQSRGDYAKALELTREAQVLSRRLGSDASLWAPFGEARALAMLGRQREADAVQRSLNEAFTHWSGRGQASMSGFGEVYLRWNEGTLASRGPSPMRGFQALEKAIAITPPTNQRFMAMQRAEQALALVREGDIAHGCSFAHQTLAGLAPWQCTGAVAAYFHHVLEAVPPRFRRLASVRDLSQALRLMESSPAVQAC